MMDYLRYFFNPGHLFSLRPPIMTQRAVTILLWIFSIAIVAALASYAMSRGKDVLKGRGYRRLAHLFMTVGLLGYLYVFFAWQGAALFSARWWLLILAVTFVVWLAFILKYLLTEAPKQRQEIEQRREKQKYIP